MVRQQLRAPARPVEELALGREQVQEPRQGLVREPGPARELAAAIADVKLRALWRLRLNQLGPWQRILEPRLVLARNWRGLFGPGLPAFFDAEPRGL